MEEKFLFDNSSEHFVILKKLYDNIDSSEIINILDCGSGRTSLSSLLMNFNNAQVDSVVYYNDLRKLNSIKKHVISNRFTILEKDICIDTINKKYDLVLAHLLLGEATTWGNSF